VGRLVALIAVTLGWQRDVRRLFNFLRSAPVPISAGFFHGLNESLVWVQVGQWGFASYLFYVGFEQSSSSASGVCSNR
jgi:hypothetical protein